MENNFLASAIKEFNYYKSLAEKTITQVPEEKFSWQFDEESNSIAMIVHHINGNMLSRWTDFLTTDGEKPWRQRDQEFLIPKKNKHTLMQEWEQAWSCLFGALSALKEADLNRIVYIRNMRHTVTEAVNRQLAHYPYHVGQIVFIGKMICGKEWKSLSIPKNQSAVYNEQHFSQPRRT